MRLVKYLAHAGVASRRASEVVIAAGRVTVDGQIVTDPARAIDGQEVRVDGEIVPAPAGEREVWLVHKPVGVVSTASDTHGRPVVTDLVDAPGRRLYPVGRLDLDSSGLLLLTDDGGLANRLTHPRYEVPKTYVVTVSGRPTAAALRSLREGVVLDDGPTAPAQVRETGHSRETATLEIVLREGRNRQVRRMCDAVGHPVVALRRQAFGPLRLGSLAPGAARRLSAAEVERLRSASVPEDPGTVGPG
ncbi:MAG: pseudouridine synthase [Baekduia sp.]